MTDRAQIEWNDEELRDAVRANPMWYHTMELRPGLVTPGYFDLRPIIDRLPWPDVRGKRCLDVGTYDGHLAFEMERRGAAEIVATDIAGHEDWDFPIAIRAQGSEYLRQFGGEKGRGFEIAAAAIGSAVRKQIINVYDLSPEAIGTFDVVTCGSLLLHLRDPFRALDAIRSVCAGSFVSMEQIELGHTIVYPRVPMTTLTHIDSVQWHVPNLAGHRRMITGAGFEIVKTIRPYANPFGPGHPPLGPHRRLQRLLRKSLLGGWGVPHSAVLARPVTVPIG